RLRLFRERERESGVEQPRHLPADGALELSSGGGSRVADRVGVDPVPWPGPGRDDEAPVDVDEPPPAPLRPRLTLLDQAAAAGDRCRQLPRGRSRQRDRLALRRRGGDADLHGGAMLSRSGTCAARRTGRRPFPANASVTAVTLGVSGARTTRGGCPPTLVGNYLGRGGRSCTRPHRCT